MYLFLALLTCFLAPAIAQEPANPVGNVPNEAASPKDTKKDSQKTEIKEPPIAPEVLSKWWKAAARRGEAVFSSAV